MFWKYLRTLHLYMAKNLEYLQTFLKPQRNVFRSNMKTQIPDPNEMEYFSDKGFAMWLINIPQTIEKTGEAFSTIFKHIPLRLDSYAFGFFEDSDRK